MRQKLLQNASIFYYKTRKFFYKMQQLLQIATTVLQIATVITKWDVYYKLRQYNQSVFYHYYQKYLKKLFMTSFMNV